MKSPIHEVDIEKMEDDFKFEGDDSDIRNRFAYISLIEDINSNPNSPNLVAGQQTFEEYIDEIRNPNLVVSTPIPDPLKR